MGNAMTDKAWVVKAAKQPMVLETVEPGSLGAEDVEVAVEHCGVCHSDLSILKNDWGISQYPAILGHEIVGRVTVCRSKCQGAQGRTGCWHRLELGERHALSSVPFGRSLASARRASDHHRSSRRIRHPRPRALGLGFPAPGKAGPGRSGTAHVRGNHRLPAAGHVCQADRSGWHHRHRWARAYGRKICRRFRLRRNGLHVELGQVCRGGVFGAHHVVSSRDSAAIKKLGGSFDLLINTVNVTLDWDAMIGALAPNGRLHTVGVVPEPIPVGAFSLIAQQRSVSGSPVGSPEAIETMLEFASRHNVLPQTEHFPMSKINEAFAHLESGKAHYRIVLDAGF